MPEQPPRESPIPAPPSAAKLAVATGVAFAAAGLLLVTVVLPAEYGIDPLGTGAALGLVVLSDPTLVDIPVRSDGLSANDDRYAVDRVSFELEPGQEVEYKYRLEAGEAMVYGWTATGPVRSEMHSERDGAPSGTAEFFEVLEAATGGDGSYVAPFPGVHGWYWVNEGEETVTVTLNASGFFDKALEYHLPDGPILRQIEPLGGGASGSR